MTDIRKEIQERWGGIPDTDSPDYQDYQALMWE